MDQVQRERVWRSKAKSVARQVNTGWWLEKFNWLLLGAGIVLSVLLICIRTFSAVSWSSLETGLVLGVMFLVLSSFAWMWSRKRFIAEEKGLVRLEERLALDSRLTAAANGVGEWPPVEEGAESTAFRWSMGTTLIPGLLAAAVVVGAWLMPLPKVAAVEDVPVVEPGAWDQMEDWIATLEEEQLIEEAGIEELEGKIEELRNQPEDEWFSHASLEATDNLQETLGKQIQEMASDLNTLERDIGALQTFSTQMSEASRQKLLEEFNEALDSLAANGMQPNEELLKKLQELDPSQLGQKSLSSLSPEQLKDLQKQLCDCNGALGSMEGLPSMGEDPSLQKLTLQELQAIGRGGIDRGRGDAPLFFGNEQDLNTENIETVENTDLSRASLGETLGLGETEHEIDETAVGPSAGGAVDSLGRGGETVSRETLLPSEQAVLKRYFK